MNRMIYDDYRNLLYLFAAPGFCYLLLTTCLLLLTSCLLPLTTGLAVMMFFIFSFFFLIHFFQNLGTPNLIF